MARSSAPGRHSESVFCGYQRPRYARRRRSEGHPRVHDGRGHGHRCRRHREPVPPWRLRLAPRRFTSGCARRFIAASRQLKSLENAAKASPLEHIDSIISGLSTVRAFGQVGPATQQFWDKVGRHARAFWHLWLLNRWLAFRINVLGAVFSAFSAAMVVYAPGVSPSTAGFAIAFTLEVSLTMALSIRRYVKPGAGAEQHGAHPRIFLGPDGGRAGSHHRKRVSSSRVLAAKGSADGL